MTDTGWTGTPGGRITSKCFWIMLKAKEMILSLTVMDFSEILQNEHKGFEHEKRYVFGKDVTPAERNGTGKRWPL